MNAPPRLGFGVSGPLGRKWFSERRMAALVAAALDGGVRHFDTAPFYGEAQERLGRALRDADARNVFISTKTGTRREGRAVVKDFSERAIRRDVEESRAALDRASLDLLYLHGPTAGQTDAARPVLDALMKEGAVKAIGVCGEGAAIARAIETGFDAVMMIYNVIDRRNEAMFAEAKSRGLMTVAIGPLAQGLFDPRFTAPRSLPDLWRLARAGLRGRYAPASVKAARAALGDDAAARALGFVLANPSVDFVMTTTTKWPHLAASLAAAARPIDPAIYEGLLSALDRNRGAS